MAKRIYRQEELKQEIQEIEKQEQKGQLARKRILKNEVLKITNGIFSSLTDTILFISSLPVMSIGQKRTFGGVNKTFNEAYDFLEEINYKKLKQVFYNLKRQGFIQSVKKPQITKAGIKRLQKNLPSYDEKRIWDGNIYLISYDIAINRNFHRDILRKKLKKLGAIKIQKSVYLVFYNPLDILKSTLDHYQLHNMILVSRLEKEGVLSEKSFKDFLWEKANLESVNEKYFSFLKKYENQENPSRLAMTLDFLSAVANDPQIPFELLRDDYLGDKAYLLFLKISK